jgi:hypothetical protein
MARRKAKAGPAQRLASYGILALLCLITAWLLFQQSRFNPAVSAALRAPLLPGLTPTGARPPAATAAFFPEVQGFTPLAPVESFGPDNLSDKIDGKAELYLPAGFKEMSCRRFGLEAAGKAYLEVFIYDMGAPTNAYAVFSGQRRPGSPDIPLTANAYATANALFFTKGRFYVEIVADRAGGELANYLTAYAGALLTKLPEEGEKAGDLTVLLPQEGLTRESIRLCATDAFCLEGLNNVLTGEYSLKSGKATAFIARRETPDQARGEARRYLDFLAANGYKPAKTQGPPTDALALDNSFEIVFVEGRTLAGVHDATTLEAAQELAYKLRAAIKAKP